MARKNKNWLGAFKLYVEPLEAPRKMFDWAGITAIAGCLRRRTWIGRRFFKWYPNFYVLLVAPPGIVSKSTTASVAMNLLKQVPGIKFGPNVVTWQSLVTSFAAAAEQFDIDGTFHTMSPITIESSELGNLLDPRDRKMVDTLITLWDGQNIEKETKFSGNDSVVNPWLNMIACTTPSWIADNFPEHMIGGGLMSRFVLVYAEKKEKLVAHPWLHEFAGIETLERDLIHDLEHISMVCQGEYKLTPDAITFGETLYGDLNECYTSDRYDERTRNYLARKQSHIYKLSQVLTAATTDEMWITDEILCAANTIITGLEPDMAKVFSKIGKTETSDAAERILWYVRKEKCVAYSDLYRYMHTQLPSMKEYEDILEGCIRSGAIRLEKRPEGAMLLPNQG